MASPKVFVAGHRGLVGSALTRELEARKYESILTRGRNELDLLDFDAVLKFFQRERPDVLLIAAAKVGGINANNTERWKFLYENLVIQNNLLKSALDCDVERVVFFGSSCIYPKHAPQPIPENALLTGALEPTNEPYAIAKIAGLKLVEAANTQYGRRWLSLMPTNLYGPGDNFDLDRSHVLPAMIRRFHVAKTMGSRAVTLWGTGTPRREFLHVDDAASATFRLLENGSTGLFNVGYGEDVTISELAGIVRDVIGYDGDILWDTNKPDGTPRKLLDSSRIRSTGWRPRIALREGIASTYAWFLSLFETSVQPQVARSAN
jgi:GDP-L-fucose synthase